jgi:hypothetical protein
MKDFEDYLSKKPWPSHPQILNDLMARFDNVPMTKDQREEKMSEMRTLLISEYERRSAEWHEDQNQLYKEFFKDCRKELGYDKLLSETGCEILEIYCEDLNESDNDDHLNIWYRNLKGLTELLKSIKTEHK